MTHYSYRKLEWDTNYFECKSSRVDITDKLTRDDMERIKELIKEDQFITVTNPKGMVENNRLITQEMAAYLVDIRVELSNTQVDTNKEQTDPFIHIQNNYAANEEILGIAKQAFTKSRFYNDSAISIEKASGMYIKWVENAFQTKEKYFCVFGQEEGIEGFILFSIANEQVVTIELIAVGDKYRKSGIGTRLIKGLYSYCIKHGYNTVKVATQVENISALNLYTKNGLRIEDMKYTYHLWNE